MALVTKFKVTGDERVGCGTVAAAATVERGTILNYTTDGKVRQANDTLGETFAGIAKESATADEKVTFDYGSPFFYANGSAVVADIGLVATISGEGAIAKTSDNRIAVGLIVDAEAGRGWWIDPIYVRSKSIWKQATTGSGGTAGEIAVSGMTVAGIVIVTAAEDPGSNLAISDAICSSGKITVYATSGSARSALSGKKINYLVLSL